MKITGFERQLVLLSRLLTAAAVLGSLAGAVLMFVLGLSNIYEAYAVWLPWGGLPEDTKVIPSSAAIIKVIEALDRFLIAIVLLYFGYGVYSLFIRPETDEKDLALPSLLAVRQIGQLKQVVAEVIIVILFVLFLRNALEAFQGPRTSMAIDEIATLLVLPLCAALLGLALRLVELHPKPTRPTTTIMTTAEEAKTAEEKRSDTERSQDRLG